MKKLTKALLALAVSVCCATTAQSTIFVNANYVATSEADIKGTTNNKLGTKTYGLKGGIDNLTFTYETTKYDFSGDFNPFSDLNKFTVDYNYRNYFASNLALYAGITVGALYEDSISISDSYKIAPRAAIGWTFSNGMTLYGGAAGILNNAKNEVLPIIGLEVGRDKDLGLTGAVGYPSTHIQYRFSPAFAANVRFETVRDTYHLDNEAKKGQAQDGYFEEKSYGLSAGVTFTPFQNIKISAGVVSFFDREFELYDKNGNKFDQFETDASWGGYIRAGLVF